MTPKADILIDPKAVEASRLVDPATDPANEVKDKNGQRDEKATEAKVKVERLKAWKREGTAAARKTAKADRVARWEEKHGMPFPKEWTP